MYWIFSLLCIFILYLLSQPTSPSCCLLFVCYNIYKAILRYSRSISFITFFTHVLQFSFVSTLSLSWQTTANPRIFPWTFFLLYLHRFLILLVLVFSLHFFSFSSSSPFSFYSSLSSSTSSRCLSSSFTPSFFYSFLPLFLYLSPLRVHLEENNLSWPSVVVPFFFSFSLAWLYWFTQS